MPGFDWTHTPDPAWVRDLAAISPPTDRLSHAELWWEAGFPWSPVQRWVLYYCVPLGSMPRAAREDWAALMDAEQPCRCSWIWSAGALCSQCLTAWPCDCGAHTHADSLRCSRCGHVRTQARSNIMAAFQRGYMAQPLWILQGEHGGHKLQYTNAERVIATKLGMAPTPPEPGSLPYAGWDQRSRLNLLNYDLAQTRLASLNGAKKEERARLARAARVATEAYLTGIIAHAREETPVTFADDLPRVEGSFVDEATASARYIETGRVGP